MSYSLAQRAEHRVAFHSSDHHADAGVDADAVSQVPGHLAPDVEAIGIGPPPGITIGARVEEQHLLARRDLDVADPRRPGRHPEEADHGGLASNRLLEGVPRQRRIVTQQLPLIGVGGQVSEREGNAAHSRVDAGREEGPDQHRTIVGGQARRLGSVVDRGADAVGPERVARARRGDPSDRLGGIGNGCAETFVLHPVAVEDERAVVEQPATCLVGDLDAEGAREHLGREWLGEIMDSVETATVEQLVHDASGRDRENSLERPQSLGCHRARDDLAVARVLGRIGLDQDARPAPRLTHGQIGEPDAMARRIGLVVAQRRHHIVVSCDRPNAIAVEPHRGARVADQREVFPRLCDELVRIRIDFSRFMHVQQPSAVDA